jgi:hypothetical protein
MKEFPWYLVADLRCPYCGSCLEATLKLAASNDGLLDGILRCDCYKYPVVQGIPVIRHIGPVSSVRNEAVEHLLRGDAAGALQWLLLVGSAPGVPRPNDSTNEHGVVVSFLDRLRHLFRSNTTSPKCDLTSYGVFEAALYASRSRGYADYLFHRFANPSFLGAIPPLVVLGDACQVSPRRRLLDLLCGLGHSSATLRALCPDVEVVMADLIS